ncbi:uncharacterized protein LTR77_009082 [Saxophila tyrrhenica]|uniref:RING-type domain-containing protein n=1 Tax=Saxophila tyrrhenica TaxID=1690608 RepID=A0AAV9NZH7_9PEZI|nr:hypothetical protein LTR77_009082 [Saxophila tyrrhenica]
MEQALRCNHLKCRTQLEDSAVVTTCSHIFCIPCSDSLGLSTPTSRTRICPACEAPLSNPDDAVISQLNPSEDYKTSVLSGLSPNTILECAGRALNFYSYQTNQEIMYQEYLARSLTDKYQLLSDQMDNIIKDANSQIRSMNNRLDALQEEKRKLEEKNERLAEAYRNKGKKQQEALRL